MKPVISALVKLVGTWVVPEPLGDGEAAPDALGEGEVEAAGEAATLALGEGLVVLPPPPPPPPLEEEERGVGEGVRVGEGETALTQRLLLHLFEAQSSSLSQAEPVDLEPPSHLPFEHSSEAHSSRLVQESPPFFVP